MTAERHGDGPLGDLHIVELANEQGQWCGRLLADLGADVIKVEPTGGARERALGPFYRDEPHHDRSLSFWHYNSGKRGVTLSLDAPEGRDLLRRLVATADVFLETQRPGLLPSLGLGPDDLRGADSRLVYCSLTPFGQDGPWRDYATTDLVQMAAGGQMASCGYDEEDYPDAPPIAPGGGNAWHIGSHFALIAIASALFYRDATGEGQFLDVSMHEACSLTTESAIPAYLHTGRVLRRQTGRHAAWSMPRPRTQFRCKDGAYVNAMFNLRMSPELLRNLAEWMDEHGAAEDLLDERYRDQETILGNQEHIADVLHAFFPRITSEEAYRGAQARNLPWGSVRTVDEVLADPHWEERGAFTEVEHPELGERFTYAGPWGIYSDSPLAISRRAPLLGEHNAEVYAALGVSPPELTVLRENGVI